jgi:N-acetylmuramoyl-L-alanine amidase
MESQAMIQRFAVVTPDQVPELLRGVERPMTRLFWHCSASDRAEHDSARVMHRWHVDREWREIGYHLFIRKDGVAELGRAWSAIPAAQSGHNTGTLAFCLHGLKREAFTASQRQAMRAWSAAIVKALPAVTIHGHCEVSNKACPVIDYRGVLQLDANGRMIAEGHPARPVPPPTMLSIGSRGQSVIDLQTALNARGEFLTVDGAYGRATAAAVKRFQLRNALTADGIYGPRTHAALLRTNTDDGTV